MDGRKPARKCSQANTPCLREYHFGGIKKKHLKLPGIEYNGKGRKQLSNPEGQDLIKINRGRLWTEENLQGNDPKPIHCV